MKMKFEIVIDTCSERMAHERAVFSMLHRLLMSVETRPGSGFCTESIRFVDDEHQAATGLALKMADKLVDCLCEFPEEPAACAEWLDAYLTARGLCDRRRNQGPAMETVCVDV